MLVFGSANLLDVLEKALPLIAVSTGGLATLTDSQGRWLSSCGPDGKTVTSEPPFVGQLTRKAAAACTPLTMTTQEDPPVQIWAIPLGAYVLAASNRARATQEKEMFQSLAEALPLIAYVAGGEAVIFDREGRRMASSLPDGKPHPDIGKTHPVFAETMALQRAIVSPSRTVPGVTSVRIPLTQNFGFGFNNVKTIRRGQQMIDEVKKHQRTRYGFGDIAGTSAAIRRAVSLAQRAADSVAPVLISGETGTGKEMFAQAIHSGSSRRDQPFLALNCAALPASLIESQLFGYVDGAFTGARRGGQAGYFEEADGGTLLLDEISEMELPLQAKLLRVLQEKEVTRTGGTKTTRIDVRIIATTNRNMREMVAAGTFRKDLYYRLCVIDLTLPALRERKEDIPILVEQFGQQFSKLTGKVITEIDPGFMGRLLEYHWPGNVRQLENSIEAAFSLAEGRTLLPQHLSPEVVGGVPGVVMTGVLPGGQAAGAGQVSGTGSAAGTGYAGEVRTLAETVQHAEREAIINALRESGGVRQRAAERLGISISTLWRKLKELQLE